VETEFLRKLDGVASSAIRRLLSALGTPGPDLITAIIYFAALQFLRVPANKEMISMTYESGVKDFIDIAFANTERAKVMIEDYETGTGKKLDITPEAMVKLAKGGTKIVATDLPFIRNVVEQASFIANVFGKMDKQVLISPEQVGFILCDNPVTLVPLQGSGPSGFLTPGSYVYTPLTRSLCLCFGQAGSGAGPRKIDRETVRLINENTAINSDRFVMGPCKIQIESVIRRSGSSDVNNQPRWTTTRTIDEKGGILRALKAQPRRVRYINLR
jgi:hypothetical protein